MRTRNLVANYLTILGLLLASCAPAAPLTPTPRQAATSSQAVSPAAKQTEAPTAPSPSPKPSAQGPKYGGTLVVSHAADPTQYDPIQEVSVLSLSLVVPCYSGVVQHDPLEPTKVIGDLAEKWDMTPDGLSYTFSLFRNVKWQDGTPFTSEDARFSLELVRKPPQGVVSPKKEWLKAVDRIDTPDKDTLKITLQYPSASFLRSLADGRMVVIPKHVFEAKGNMKKDIVGTGPFKYKSFTPGASFSVVKNADYFIKGRPYLDGIMWYIIPDIATRFAALRTRRVQLTPLGSHGLTPSQSELVAKEMSDKIIVQKYPGLTFQTFWMLQTKAPWNDIRVRRAVELTIDRPKILKVAAEGVGDLGSFMPKGPWALPESELFSMPGWRQPKDSDIAEAKRLMAEAGYPNGFKTTGMARPQAWPERSIVSVKEQLAQIGIDITVSIKDQGTLMDLVYKRAFDTAVQFASGAFDDPDQILGSAFVTGVAYNISQFSDEKIDKWYDEQARTLDPAKRKEIVLDMQRRMHELVPCSVLFWSANQMGNWKEVSDFKPGLGLYNNLKFQNVWLAE